MAKDIENDNVNEKLKQLQEMRKARSGEEAPSSTPVIVKTTIGEDPPAVEAKPAQARDEDGKFVKVEAPADEAPKVEKPAVDVKPADAAPSLEEIELDGQKVSLHPSLAAAIRESEKVKAADATPPPAADRDALKAELLKELKDELKVPAADAAAAAALQAAEDAAKLPKKPDAQLLVTDPDEWQKQQDAYDEARLKIATEATKRETLAEIQRQTQQQNQSNQKAQEEWARAQLREQFYRQYDVLRTQSELVDPLLEAKFNEVIASGRLAKKLTPEEAEDMKRREFADVAASATRKVVSVMTAGKKIAPPPPPPTLVASAPQKPAPQKIEEPKERAPKFPPNSMSAALAARKASRDGASA